MSKSGNVSLANVKKKQTKKKHFYCIEIYSNKNRVGVLEDI